MDDEGGNGNVTAREGGGRIDRMSLVARRVALHCHPAASSVLVDGTTSQAVSQVQATSAVEPSRRDGIERDAAGAQRSELRRLL